MREQQSRDIAVAHPGYGFYEPRRRNPDDRDAQIDEYGECVDADCIQKGTRIDKCIGPD